MELAKFFHRLWNPHCSHCQAEDDAKYERARDDKVCNACEILKMELARAHDTINRLLTPKMAEPSIEKEEEELKPIPMNRRPFVPMAVRQQMQDKQDQKTLELLIAANKRATEVTVSEETPTDDKKVDEMERDILAAPPVGTAVNNG